MIICDWNAVSMLLLRMRLVRIETIETREAARYEASDTAGKDQQQQRWEGIQRGEVYRQAPHSYPCVL